MKKIPLSLLIFILLIYSGCSRCGKNIDLGNFKLTPSSIEDWFPYKELNELTFVNGEGEIINLQIEKREELMNHSYYREICSKSSSDVSYEIFYGEYLSVEYRGINGDIKYEISVIFTIIGTYYHYHEEYSDLRLADQITYHLEINNDGNYLFGYYQDYVNYHGSGVPDDDLGIVYPDFAAEIEISGKTYNDVWYYPEDLTSGFPALYIQQGQGIIAFQGLNNEVWTLQ